MTSSWFSPVLGHPLGLAWVHERARAQEGASVARSTTPRATIAGHALYDPEGVKLRA